MVVLKEDSVERWKNELVQEVLLWWKEHEYDVKYSEDEEYNVYDEEPRFVTIAKKISLRL